MQKRAFYHIALLSTKPNDDDGSNNNNNKQSEVKCAGHTGIGMEFLRFFYCKTFVLSCMKIVSHWKLPLCDS